MKQVMCTYQPQKDTIGEERENSMYWHFEHSHKILTINYQSI